jgi:MoxR-like ATPase
MEALETAYRENVSRLGYPDFASLDAKFDLWNGTGANKGWHSYTLLTGVGIHHPGKAKAKAVPQAAPPPCPVQPVQADQHEHPAFRRLLAWVKSGTPVMMVGPAGSGKTTAASLVAKELGIPFLPQSFCNQTPESRFVGFMAANGKYIPSGFYEVFKNGGVYLMDEFDACNANVAVAFNAAVANGYYTFPNGEKVQVHPDFRCIAAANTWGKGSDREYQGRNPLDAATLDRFAKVAWDYDEAHELRISPRADWTKHVQKIRRACQALGIRTVISPRASINGGKALDSGALTWAQVEEDTVFSGMDRPTVEKIRAAIK